MLNGIVFDHRNVNAKNDGQIYHGVYAVDGVLSGCGITFTSNTVTVADGYFMMCGREIQENGAETIEVTPKVANGYMRMIHRIDLNAAPSGDEWTQSSWDFDYNTTSTFPALVQQDLNASGKIYEVEFAVFRVANGNLSSVYRKMGAAGIHAVDAQMLGGQLPAFYAKQSDFDVSVMFRGSLGETSNLNDYKQNGIWRQANSTYVTTALNYPPMPSVRAGVLAVFSPNGAGGTGGSLVQLYTPYDTATVYSRVWNGSVWSEWNNSIDTALCYRGELETRNLNNIYKNGIYVQKTQSNATAARNYPQTYAGTLIVSGSNNADAGVVQPVSQIYISRADGCVCTRSWNGTDWSSWFIPASQADMDLTFPFRGNMSGKVNFNTIYARGLYQWGSAPQAASTVTGAVPPVTSGGSLLVYSRFGAGSGAVESGLTQLYIGGNGQACIRGASSTGWGAWRMLLTDNGSQSINGTLTLTGLQASANVNADGYVKADGNGVFGGYVAAGSNGRVQGGGAVGLLNTNQSYGLAIWNGTHMILPCDSSRAALDNDAYLGSSGGRFKGVYSAGGVITTSDRRKKTQVREIDKGFEFGMALAPSQFVLADGDSGRVHFGFIAQQVKEAMEKAGITDFAGFVRGPLDPDAEYSDDVPEEDVLYGLRYEEFIPVAFHMIQKQQARIDDLERRLAALEARAGE